MTETTTPESNDALETAPVESLEGESAEQAAEAAEPRENLYELEVERFRAMLKGSVEAALDRYGFTIVHSLKPEEYVAWQEKLGFPPGLARDFYNLGCVAAREERYDEAVKQLEACLKLDREFAPAYFNLGVIAEQKEDKAGAVKHYQKYCDLLQSQDAHQDYLPAHIQERENEAKQIRHHIEMLSK